MYKIIRPILFHVPAETIHDAVHKTAQIVQKNSFFLKQIHSFFSFEDSRLNTTVCGNFFPNPIGLAAGFDKNGEIIPFIKNLGFGFAEIGSVTLLPQPGNPKPRLFRLEKDQALINRMGLNGYGAQAIQQRLSQTQTKNMKIWINIGKNKTTPNEHAWKDYEQTFQMLLPYAQGFVVNVSSPNTSGLRDLQEKNALKKILQTLQQIKNQSNQYTSIPLFVKISPDLTFQKISDILEVLLENKIQGIVISNTTVQRNNLVSKHQSEIGGLSGIPLKNVSTNMIRFVFQQTNGSLPIIGVGGIFTPEDAYEKIQAGASLVEIYSGMIYQGPGIVKKIKQGLVRLLEKDGFTSVKQAVGSQNFLS